MTLHKHILFAEAAHPRVGSVCFFWIVFYGVSRASALRQATIYRNSAPFELELRKYARRNGINLERDVYHLYSRPYEQAVTRGDIIESRLRLDPV